jgi:hypothetical protein
MKTPYFYIIRHIPSQKYYAGCKINSLADSSNLMTEKGYKTTSKIIKNIIKIDGLESFDVLKIKHFNFADEALYYESKFLRKVNAAENPKFINLHNGGKNFVNKGGYKLSDLTKNKMKKPKSEVTIEKQNKEKTSRPKEVYEKMVNTRKERYDTWNNEAQRTAISEANKKRWNEEENRKKHSDIMKDYYKNNPVSEETKTKKKETSKGDRNGMFGKIHNESTREKMKLAWEKRKQKNKL